MTERYQFFSSCCRLTHVGGERNKVFAYKKTEKVQPVACLNSLIVKLNVILKVELF